MYSIYRCKFILLGIRQTGKAVDSESIIYWFETSMPNLVEVPFYRSLFCLRRIVKPSATVSQKIPHMGFHNLTLFEDGGSADIGRN